MIIFVVKVAGFIGGRILTAIGIRALAGALVAGSVRGILYALARIAFTALLAINFVTIVNFIVAGVRYIVNFNWNISDSAIDSSINNSYKAIAGMAGSAFGVTCGWLLSGAVGTALVAKINPLALGMIVDNVAAEAADEIYDEWASFCYNVVQKMANNLFLSAYKSARSFLKRSGVAAKILGTSNAAKWGANNGPPVTIAKAIEDAIESIPNELARSFIEEFWEELWDSAVEGFVLFAQNLDLYKSQQIAASYSNSGAPEVIDIIPDRSRPNENRIVLFGPSRAIEPHIGIAISQARAMRDKDMGVIFAPSFDDSIKHRIPSATKVEAYVEYFNLPMGKPPLPKKGKRRAEYKIPNFNPMYLNDYDRIKRQCSLIGTSGFFSGKYYVTAELSNNGKSTVRCDSNANGKALIEKLLELSDGVTARSFSGYTQIAGGGIDESEIDSSPVRMYPYRIVFLREKRSTDPSVGAVRNFDGKRVTYSKQSLLLWPDTKPANWDSVISELMLE